MSTNFQFVTVTLKKHYSFNTNLLLKYISILEDKSQLKKLRFVLNTIWFPIANLGIKFEDDLSPIAIEMLNFMDENPIAGEEDILNVGLRKTVELYPDNRPILVPVGDYPISLKTNP